MRAEWSALVLSEAVANETAESRGHQGNRMQASPMPSPLRGAHPSRSAEKTRVLVVEDENDIAGLVKHTLERSGDSVVEIASSGDQALKLASEQTPDLIILDLNLPVLGGLEVCRLLRTRPTTAKTPIIMLTARTT